MYTVCCPLIYYIIITIVSAPSLQACSVSASIVSAVALRSPVSAAAGLAVWGAAPTGCSPAVGHGAGPHTADGRVTHGHRHQVGVYITVEWCSVDYNFFLTAGC